MPQGLPGVAGGSRLNARSDGGPVRVATSVTYLPPDLSSTSNGALVLTIARSFSIPESLWIPSRFCRLSKSRDRARGHVTSQGEAPDRGLTSVLVAAHMGRGAALARPGA